MAEVLEFISDKMGVLLGVLLGLLVLLTIIRSMVKLCKGKKVNITPVGVYRDLSGSVTGLNKHKNGEKR
ncbi:MAG: hypothetical protein PUD12_01645 [Firmicutes bacterium]|nr:hypothetical protein [Bacillota bacterium]